jgi:hypothetical protein
MDLSEIAYRISIAADGSSSTPEKYKHIKFTPPKSVKKAAARGLKWRSKYGRGGTEVGIARARDLSNGKRISPRTARRMKAFFDRHEKNKSGVLDNGQPSNGKIAWALWGGSPGRSWANKLVRQMNAADDKT